jgi:hypothetical protein
MTTSEQSTSRSDEASVRQVFHDTLDLIHIALVRHYGLCDSEATELETDLFMWFQRFCQRPGTRSPRESQQFLLVACCEFARDYQKYVVSIGERNLDDRLRRILDRDPRDVANDFSRGLQLLRFRYTP